MSQTHTHTHNRQTITIISYNWTLSTMLYGSWFQAKLYVIRINTVSYNWYCEWHSDWLR